MASSSDSSDSEWTKPSHLHLEHCVSQSISSTSLHCNKLFISIVSFFLLSRTTQFCIVLDYFDLLYIIFILSTDVTEPCVHFMFKYLTTVTDIRAIIGMDESDIGNELILGASTEMAARSSSYQTFLQQMNMDNNLTHLCHDAQDAGIKEASLSNVQVYQKNPPPSYDESQFHQHSVSEVDSSRKPVNGLVDVDTKLLVKSEEAAEEPPPISAEFSDKLICKSNRVAHVCFFFCEWLMHYRH